MGLNSFILIYLHEQSNEEIVYKAEKVFRLIYTAIYLTVIMVVDTKVFLIQMNIAHCSSANILVAESVVLLMNSAISSQILSLISRPLLLRSVWHYGYIIF